MRVLGVVVLAVVVSALGGIQVLSSVVLRERAQAGSWVDVLAPALVSVVERIDPRVPLPPALRLAIGRAALAARDLPRADAEVAYLAPSRDRFALEAGVAEARGDDAGALAAYLAAGDVRALEARVERLVVRRRFDDALALQHTIVERLRADRTQVDALAEASFRLGRLEQTRAYAIAVGLPERGVHERLARDAYASAVRLSPLTLLYVLALGNQQLNVADIDAAVRTFERAREIDPTSADAVVGLGDAALRRGDTTAARAFAARARALDPTAPAVGRLARSIGL